MWIQIQRSPIVSEFSLCVMHTVCDGGPEEGLIRTNTYNDEQVPIALAMRYTNCQDSNKLLPILPNL